MANVLTLIRAFDYKTVRHVLVVQTGSVGQIHKLFAALRKEFPGCRLDAVVASDDVGAMTPGEFHTVTAISQRSRIATLRTLRSVRYDAIAVPLGNSGSRFFRAMPYLLRTKNVLLFNENIDYFPLKLVRLRALAQHVTGQHSLDALGRWILARTIVLPLATLLLVVLTARIELRAFRRRRRRSRRAELS